jgi:hypothetical protein
VGVPRWSVGIVVGSRVGVSYVYGAVTQLVLPESVSWQVIVIVSAHGNLLCACREVSTTFILFVHVFCKILLRIPVALRFFVGVIKSSSSSPDPVWSVVS